MLSFREQAAIRMANYVSYENQVHLHGNAIRAAQLLADQACAAWEHGTPQDNRCSRCGVQLPAAR